MGNLKHFCPLNFFNNQTPYSILTTISCDHDRCISFQTVFSPSSAFDPLRGISRVRKFVSPNIFAYLEDICKKIFFLGKFAFFTKKADFRAFFLLFLSPSFVFHPICFPQYFGISRRYMQKKFGNFF